jgi:hypothetical protein
MVVTMHFSGTAVLEAFASQDVRTSRREWRATEYVGIQRGGLQEPLLGTN